MNHTAPSAKADWSPRTFMGFVMPVTALLYLVSSPHSGPLALLWLLPLAGSIALDLFGPDERRPPTPAPEGRGDGVLRILFGLQILNVALGAWTAVQYGFAGWTTWIGALLVGISSGYSGIVVAHELMHRSSSHQRTMARILMGSVLYEHFFTEHLRGHHVRVGTAADPATARFDESFFAFFGRTVVGQFKSAWRLECERCGVHDGAASMHDWLQHRVLQGVVLQAGSLAVLSLWLGSNAAFFHLGQAFVAVTLLECVNYFEHWGLQRQEQKVRTIDSWDTDSSLTLNTLVGLSRHADHHAHASRPYHQLRHTEDSPKLPMGYFAMVPYVLFFNPHFRRTMTAELKGKGLGPFAEIRRAHRAAG